MPAMFYWQGEDVNDATAVMHFEMTKRAYERITMSAPTPE
jgi:hypothetical protein